jgi:hypothetical protein
VRLGISRSDGSRPSLDCSSTKSVKTSAGAATSSAIIGGWLEIVSTTVTRTLRRCTASSSERKSPIAGKQYDLIDVLRELDRIRSIAVQRAPSGN